MIFLQASDGSLNAIASDSRCSTLGTERKMRRVPRSREAFAGSYLTC